MSHVRSSSSLKTACIYVYVYAMVYALMIVELAYLTLLNYLMNRRATSNKRSVIVSACVTR